PGSCPTTWAGACAPRRGRHLPTVLSTEQAASLLTTVGPEGPTGSNSSTDHPVDQEPGSDPLQRAVALRDLAVLELLYSSGLRVSELVALDRSGIDRGQRTVRVTGKGAKERIVPVGAPALDAIARWEQ